jgi:hypothetical protein
MPNAPFCRAAVVVTIGQTAIFSWSALCVSGHIGVCYLGQTGKNLTVAVLASGLFWLEILLILTLTDFHAPMLAY